MFLFNPDSAPRQNLAELLREEAREEQVRFLPLSYVKKEHKDSQTEVIGGIPYQKAGGGRRRLSTRSDY